MQKIAILICVSVLWLSIECIAQPKWQRSEPPKTVDLALFHSPMTANFPTTETLGKGDFMYEISHRFLPAIKEGFRAFWGIDGPAQIRTAISYGITDKMMVSLGHSNLLDNMDLQLKLKLFQIRSETLPGVIAIRGGIAVNTEVPESLNRGSLAGENFQYYTQLVYNTMLFNKKFGIGIVPSYLYNSNIFTVENQYTFTLGNYYQFYLNQMWSFWLELNPIISGYQGFVRADELGTKSHNHFATGLDIETGGHVFHLFVTNNSRINPSQFIVGSDKSAEIDHLRLGFGITRHF